MYRSDAVSFPQAQDGCFRPRLWDSEEADLDDEVQFLSALEQICPSRRHKLINVRAQISRGDYLTEEKLHKAVSRLVSLEGRRADCRR